MVIYRLNLLRPSKKNKVKREFMTSDDKDFPFILHSIACEIKRKKKVFQVIL